MRKALIRLSVAFIALAAAESAQAATSFRVEVAGHGRPIVFIPGLASSGDTWKSAVERYRDRYTCHVLTLAGFAGAPPIQGPLLATARDEIAAYIREQHLDRPVIVGHSLGGTLTLDLAIHEPGLVGPIVIVDALPFMAGASGQAKTLADAKPMVDQMLAAINTQTPEQAAQFYRGPNAPIRYMVTGASDMERIIGWGMASDGRTVTRSMAELFSMDLRDDLARIQAPTLLIGTWSGLRDQMKAYGADLTRAQVTETFERQFSKLPQLHFAMAETARHFVMLDDPTWFFGQLDAFLADPSNSVRNRGFGSR
jgi:pimeloyl-ACP methyl ester carboxylesterase